MTAPKADPDIKVYDKNYIVKRAKSIPKKKCRCGNVIPATDSACDTCYAMDLRKLAGLAPTSLAPRIFIGMPRPL